MIREFQINDLDSVMKLWLDTNIAAHDFVDESYWRGNYDSVREMIPAATIYVYEDGSIMGFTGLIEKYIAGIFVDQSSQSKGIGKSLLNYIKERYEELTLHVYKNNTRAVNFYLREGFVIEREEIDENTNQMELGMKWSKR